MAYTKTTWIDRAVEFAKRFTKSNETSTEVTLDQKPGIVTQAGTTVNATLLNKMEQGIFDAAATADAAVPKAGGTMTGPLTSSGNGSFNGAQIGNNVSTGFHYDVNNIALRINSVTGDVYFQNAGGSITYATIGSNGIILNGVTQAQTRTINGYVEWNNAGTWQGVGGVKSVQRGMVVLNASTASINAPVAAVVMAKSSINFSFRSSNTAAMSGSADTITGTLTSTTNILFERVSAAVTPIITISWELTEYY